MKLQIKHAYKTQTYFKLTYVKKIKLFMYMYEIETLKWCFQERGNRRCEHIFKIS